MRAEPVLTPDAKAAQLQALTDALRDVVEVVPMGEPITCLRHGDSVFAAPGVVLRETCTEIAGEGPRERSGR